MKNLRSRCAGVFTLAILVACAVFAADPGEPAERVARTTITVTGVEWHPQAAYERIEVRVTRPDGSFIQKTFAAGAPAALRLEDLSSKTPPDGTYTYELRALPQIPDEIRARIARAEESREPGAAPRVMKEAGIDPTLVLPGAPESTQRTPSRVDANDQFIDGDLIVDGSACVGDFCAAGEAFGTESLKLKNHAVRLLFDDTDSSDSGNPFHDWALFVNDFGRGGQNRFSIENRTLGLTPFTIQSSAPTNTLVVAKTGRIGIGTSEPIADVHIRDGAPSLRLEEASAVTGTVRTWDLRGGQLFMIGESFTGPQASFVIESGAANFTTVLNRFGNVAMGNFPTDDGTGARLVIHDDRQTVARIALTGQEYFAEGVSDSKDGVALLLGANRLDNRQLWIADTDRLAQNTTNGAIRFIPTQGEISSVFTDASPRDLVLNSAGGNIAIGRSAASFPIHHSTGAHLDAGGTWTNASSRAFKQDIADLTTSEALDALTALQPVRFAYKADPSDPHVGFIAEDVPELVATPNRQGLSPMDIAAVLTKVVQEQRKTIADLAARVEALEKKE